VRSTNRDCERIAHAVAKMLRGSRVTCTHQFDTDVFLVTVELRQRIRTFRLPMAEYKMANWRQVLLQPLSDWLRTMPALGSGPGSHVARRIGI
jgi:hypothetical protein